jgi:hypothetical protein
VQDDGTQPPAVHNARDKVLNKKGKKNSDIFFRGGLDLAVVAP